MIIIQFPFIFIEILLNNIHSHKKKSNIMAMMNHNELENINIEEY